MSASPELIVVDSGRPSGEPEWTWYLDLGPFYDRFGSAQMAVLKSTNADIVAIRANLSVRKWVDLRLPIVAQSVAAIAAIVPEVTPAIASRVMTIQPTLAENLALRKQFFS
ncbi:hypothetical protein [Undibacterium sp. Ren11W]|uniref:hypothetical protein n=1 Tax=Undibacterium sp. Ren11W TaxID=3413045 RepID=UPI003BF27F7E